MNKKIIFSLLAGSALLLACTGCSNSAPSISPAPAANDQSAATATGEASSAVAEQAPTPAAVGNSNPSTVPPSSSTPVHNPAAAGSLRNYANGMRPQSASSSRRGNFGGQDIPAGAKQFFGQVSAVSGSTITVSGFRGGSSQTIDLTGGTQITGGTGADIVVGTRISGYGTANSDNSINAEQLRIMPARTRSTGGSQ
jgi:Domain of unknown function (DUF5666)